MPRIRAAVHLLALALAPLAGAEGPAPASLQDVGPLSRGLIDLAGRVRPSVVEIAATGYAVAEGSALISRQQSTGSGVIVDPDGYVVTNAHVVEGAVRIRVTLPGPPSEPASLRSVLKPRGRTLTAQLVGLDRETDVAVLKLPESGLAALSFGNSEALRQGQLVMAFGSPLGLDSSVSLGIVSAVARQLKPDERMIYIQTDASINPGNSGGPLVDGDGKIVGINSMILTQSGGSEGLGFAAPSNIVRRVVEQLRASGRVHRGQIGARAQTITPLLAAGLGLSQSWGVLLSDVKPDGPAAKAGLAIGDLVVSLDGKPMENARQFDVNLYRRTTGETLSIEVLREQRKWLVRVDVAERPDDADRLAEMVNPENNVVRGLGILGLDLDDRVAALLPALRAKAGVVVAMAAAGAGGSDPLRAGDVIYSLNGEPVPGLDKLRLLIAALKPGGPVVLQVERSSELRYLAFEWGE